VEGVLRAYGIFSAQKALLVACSGGSDSLALLDLLVMLHGEGGPRILCAHFEHGIRKEESHIDAEFVADVCAQWGVPFIYGAKDVPHYARAHRLSLETAARECRYAFLRRERMQHGCDYIVTGHHADDLAETVLMRILRGTGTTGLAAMREKDGVLLRPLLAITRATIEAYIQKRHLHPRHDATNDDVSHAVRNRIRHCLLPELRKYYNPSLVRALTQLSTLAAEEDAFLAGLAEEAFLHAYHEKGLSQKVLRGLHPALQRRVLRMYWVRETGRAKDFSYLHEERMRALVHVETVARCGLPHGYTASSGYGYIALHRTEPCTRGMGMDERMAEIFLPMEREYAIIKFRGFAIHMRRISCMTAEDRRSMAVKSAVYVDLAQVPPLVLRTRRAGDYVRLSVGRKKIKEIFIDDKVPRACRDDIPLIALAGTHEILWIAGGRRSVLALVTESSRDILKIECTKETIEQ
jgi:tRNA(ile)-lysidine synthetase